MLLDEQTIERLRDQIRKEGFVESSKMAAYVCFWKDSSDPVIITSSHIFDAVECEDVIRITDGVNTAYASVAFYEEYIAPKNIAKAYKDAIDKAKRNKRPWWKKILGLK